jgi:proton-dependent oligopeptide transporter, POT family
MVLTQSRATHPPGLYVLFFTELWERYSFYSMMAILTLYMDEALRFEPSWSGSVYGGYIAGVYFMPLIGGLIADRLLGFNRGVFIGGALMCLGHFVLAFESLPFFYSALVLLAVGSGFLKPNISTIVGNLYRDRPELRDAGYNIFYMGINVGALISPICVSYFRAHYGWPVAFGSAGVAMLISLGVFAFGNKHVAAAARKVEKHSAEAHIEPADARARVFSLIVIFVIGAVFWLAFYQNGFSLTFFARDNTATSISPEVFQSVEPFFIVVLTPLLVATWAALRRRGMEPATVYKLFIGMLFSAGAFLIMWMASRVGGDTGRVSAAWLVVTYAVLALGEICLSPMGLSLVNKVAPPRARGVMMGGWFLTLSMGGYMAGRVGGDYWTAVPHSQFFFGVAAAVLGAAAVLLIVLRWIRGPLAAAEAA